MFVFALFLSEGQVQGERSNLAGEKHRKKIANNFFIVLVSLMKFSQHFGDIFRDLILKVQALGSNDSLHAVPEVAAGVQDAVSRVEVPDL